MKILILNLAAMALLLVIIVLAVFYIYLPSVSNHGEEVSVPNLAGKSVIEVEKLLRETNIKFEVIDTIDFNKEKFAPWSVVNQFPAAHSTVKPNRTLRISLQSDKRPLVTLPNVFGSISSAQTQLKARRLVLGDIEYVEADGRAAVLKVIIDDIEYTEEDFKKEKIKIQTGTVVNLIVANGLDDQNIPNMVDVSNRGLTLDEAEVIIIGNGLLMGKIIETPSRQPTGTIVGQRPRSRATDVRTGQLVTLFVSSGIQGLDTTDIDLPDLPDLESETDTTQ